MTRPRSLTENHELIVFVVLLQPVALSDALQHGEQQKRREMSRHAKPDGRQHAQPQAAQQNPPRPESIAQRTEEKLAQHVDGQICRIDVAEIVCVSTIPQGRTKAPPWRRENDCRVR